MTLLPKVGELVPGATKIGRYLVSTELEKAVDYLLQGAFSASQVGGGITIVSILMFAAMTAALRLWFNIIGAVTLSFSLSLITALILVNVYTSRYQNHVARIEKVTPYVLEELVTVYLSTRSVFEAILYVSKGPYEPISSALRKFIGPMNEGCPPEKLLNDLALNQPSTTLKRGLLAFISFVETLEGGIGVVIQNAHENVQRNFECLTMQWESRMMVYSGILVFFPLIVALGITMRGLAGNPFILLLPLMQYLLSGVLQRLLLPKDVILLGE